MYLIISPLGNGDHSQPDYVFPEKEQPQWLVEGLHNTKI